MDKDFKKVKNSKLILKSSVKRDVNFIKEEFEKESLSGSIVLKILLTLMRSI